MPETGSIPPANPLTYEGQVVVPFINRPFSPQSTFNKFPVPTLWINTSSSAVYILVSKALGVAVWVHLGNTGTVDHFTLPDSTVISPDLSGNINLTSTGGTIAITGSSDTINFDVISGVFVWHDVISSTQTIAVQNGYITDNVGGVTYTLPSTSVVGDEFIITGKSGLWTVHQNASQQILLGNQQTTAGATGTLTATNVGDSITCVCITANLVWRVYSSVGNITLA